MKAWRCFPTLIAALILAGAVCRGQTNGPATPTNTAPAAAEQGPGDVPVGRDGARLAQHLYRHGKYKEAASAYLQAARGGSRSTQQDAQYNAAVSLFKAGEYRQAADVFREIVRAEGPEAGAARGLGASLFNAAQATEGDTADALTDRATLLRNAGEAFKEAFRTDDRLAEHNLAVVLEKLPEAEEQAKIARLLKEYGDTPPFALVQKMRSDQQAIIDQAPAAFTNDTPARITDLESLAERQDAVTDLWIPLKGKLQGAPAQQGQGGTTQSGDLNRFVEHVRDVMSETAASFRDLEPRAYDSAVAAEDGVYQMWKGLAPYAPLLEEDLERQTNTIDATRAEIEQSGKALLFAQENQSESAGLTKLFVQRFTQAVPETPPVTTTNTPPASGQPPQKAQISSEDRAKILELAEQAQTAQKQALDLLQNEKTEQSLPLQEQSYELLKEIQSLLPKNKSQSKNQQQQQQQKQNDQQQQNQQDQQKQDQQKQKDQQKQPQENPPPENQPQPPRDQQPNQPENNQPEPMADQELENLMQKALQREQEYKDAKERLQRTVPLAPDARDW